MAAALGGLVAGLLRRQAPAAPPTPTPAPDGAGYTTTDLSQGQACTSLDVYRYDANNELIGWVHYDPPGETRVIDIPPS
jgi:hypothetical protein